MTVYYVTVNRPGFMPESAPVGCESLADAQSCLADELETTAEYHPGTSDADLAAALDMARISPPDVAVMLAGYAHSITESDEAF